MNPPGLIPFGVSVLERRYIAPPEFGTDEITCVAVVLIVAQRESQLRRTLGPWVDWKWEWFGFGILVDVHAGVVVRPVQVEFGQGRQASAGR